MMRAVRDLRCGRRDRWVILPEGVERLVQVPDEMRKSVVFLYYRKNGERLPAGTAFFGGWPVPDHSGRALTILLTVHHVIAGIDQHADDGQVLLRINTKAGDAAWAEVPATAWWRPDPTLDCAALLWQPDVGMKAEWRGWYLGSSATKQGIFEEGIDLGDEVFMVGLFRNHLGRDRNEPILRVGNIAAMPTDPIKTRLYGDMPAILVEARSIGGLSGSPVFVHLGFSRWRDGQVATWSPESGMSGPFMFLGLMHGHWDALGAEVDTIFDTGEKINMGIGIVVPAEQIIGALRPLMEEIAMTRKQQIDEATAPSEDSAVEETTEFERFNALAQKLVHVPKKELDEKRKESEG